MKQKLLKHCKYYKGEEEPPISFGQEEKVLWDYERGWVYDTMNESITIRESNNVYLNANLSLFSLEDETPVSLKAYLFLRYIKFNGRDREGFKQMYLKYYKEKGD